MIIDVKRFAVCMTACVHDLTQLQVLDLCNEQSDTIILTAEQQAQMRRLLGPGRDVRRVLESAALQHAGVRAALDGINRGACPDLMLSELLNGLLSQLNAVRSGLDSHGAEWLAGLADTSARTAGEE